MTRATVFGFAFMVESKNAACSLVAELKGQCCVDDQRMRTYGSVKELGEMDKYFEYFAS
jgi:hypothetical protein